MKNKLISKALPAAIAGVILSAGTAMAVTTADVCAGFSSATSCIFEPNTKSGGNVKSDEMNEVAKKQKSRIDTDGDGDFSGVFNLAGWFEIDKIGTVKGSGTQSGENAFFFLDFTSGTAGSWKLGSDYIFGSGSYAFALKGSIKSAIYLLDTVSTSGTWSMGDLKNGGGNIPDLSNIRLFGTTSLMDAPLSPVPLPAGGLLLLTGAGFLAGVRRLRRTA